METADEKYEVSLRLATAVSMAGIKLGKENNQIVEETLRRDPLIAEMVEMLDNSEDLPDYNPKRTEKIPA